MKNLNKVIVDVPLLKRVEYYKRIDEFIRSSGVGVVKGGFVKDRIQTIFNHFRVRVVPTENVEASVEANSKLAVPLLDRVSQKKYLMYVGDLINEDISNQMNLI